MSVGWVALLVVAAVATAFNVRDIIRHIREIRELRRKIRELDLP